MTVAELIDFLECCQPDAEVLIGQGNTTVEKFIRISDIMAWSGAPILWIGKPE